MRRGERVRREKGKGKDRRRRIVGLQKLQIQGESLVPIGANLLDFFLSASPGSHHPHQASQTGQFMVSFSPNVSLFTGHFFQKMFSDRKRSAPLRFGWVLGPFRLQY